MLVTYGAATVTAVAFKRLLCPFKQFFGDDSFMLPFVNILFVANLADVDDVGE